MAVVQEFKIMKLMTPIGLKGPEHVLSLRLIPGGDITVCGRVEEPRWLVTPESELATRGLEIGIAAWKLYKTFLEQPLIGPGGVTQALERGSLECRAIPRVNINQNST